MIHAEYCYDSNPIDRWFEEEIEITDLLYWHLERFFDPEYISIEDESYWRFYVHWGGYRITLGERLNQPIRAILNEPGIWVPDLNETFDMVSEVAISIDGVEVYRREETDQRPAVVLAGLEWAAQRLGAIGPSVHIMQFGGNVDASGQPVITMPEMTGLIGPFYDIAVLNPRGGTVAGQEITFRASLDAAVGPYIIGEIGLFTQNRVMIAREVLTAGLVKDANKAMDVVWTLTIV